MTLDKILIEGCGCGLASGTERMTNGKYKFIEDH